MIGVVMKTWRHERKLSLRTVASSIGINHRTLDRIERGRDVDGATLIKLINWLFSDLGR